VALLCSLPLWSGVMSDLDWQTRDSVDNYFFELGRNVSTISDLRLDVKEGESGEKLYFVHSRVETYDRESEENFQTYDCSTRFLKEGPRQFVAHVTNCELSR